MDNIRHIHPRRIWLFSGLFALPLCVMGLLLLLPTLSAQAASSSTEGCKEPGQTITVEGDTKGQKITSVCNPGDAKGLKTTAMCIVGAKGPGIPDPVGAKGPGAPDFVVGTKGSGAPDPVVGTKGSGTSGIFTGPDGKGQKVTCTVQDTSGRPVQCRMQSGRKATFICIAGKKP